MGEVDQHPDRISESEVTKSTRRWIRLGCERAPFGIRSEALCGFLLEKRRDTLAGYAEQLCDGFDGEPLRSKGESLSGSELGAGSLEGRHVGRNQFGHPGDVFGCDEVDEACSGLKPLPLPASTSLQLPATFGIVSCGGFDVREGSEEPFDRLVVRGHGTQ